MHLFLINLVVGNSLRALSAFKNNNMQRSAQPASVQRATVQLLYIMNGLLKFLLFRRTKPYCTFKTQFNQENYVHMLKGHWTIF